MCDRDKKEHSCSCPSCSSRHHLVHYYTLYLNLDGWPVALLFSAVVSALCSALALSPNANVWFSILAAIPPCFSLVGKSSCTNCEIEFERGAALERVQASDLRPSKRRF